MEEKKIIGMPYNCVLGLTWLLFPFGIVALAVDHEKMTKDEKQAIVQVFVYEVFAYIVSVILSIVETTLWAVLEDAGWFKFIAVPINLVIWGIALIMMIEAFLSKYVHMPLCWNIAGNFVKETATKPEEKSEAGEKPEAEDTVTDNDKTEE